MATIGFIGLGNMGGPKSRNLLKAGHHLRAFDVVPSAVERAVLAGAQRATDVADATTDAAVVVTMLPAGEHVREVYLGDGGVIAAAAPGTLLIDCSTIDVATAREVIAVAATAGFDMIDAPVSGGVAGAEAATLTFMVGGNATGFAAAEPILKSMGKTVVHTGGPGNGQAAKICNNLILGISMIAVCEAFVLAEKLGLPSQTLFDVASQSSGQCWSLTSYCPVPGPVPTSPANRAYRPGFSAAMMLKDLRLAQTSSTDATVATPLGAHAAALYADFVAQGGQDLDFSGIITLLRTISTDENRTHRPPN
ncbi:MAG TPA: 3-hydroxyisobutyrate dehydrogenase [Thermomicrobiales bacterium]|nr:3-hydroxyisobutyrate dehydrogenase [Thermomicrobiales bacterium]